jgi:hypothetical protein
MRLRYLAAATVLTATTSVQQFAQQPPPTALTIYNQNFAVARATVDLDLHPGSNEVTTTQVTSQLEPDSVVLRDPSGKPSFSISEQNYDSALVSQDWMLQHYEGKTIDFQLPTNQNGQTQIVKGSIIRAPGSSSEGQHSQPLIEVDGKMQFQLPGTPLFPAATDNLLLKPTLRWQIHAEKSEKLAAELAYVTGGLSWEATYNIVAPEDTAPDQKADIVGWVTIHNQSGTDFPQTSIKLMAGDVAKIVNQPRVFAKALAFDRSAAAPEPQVTQKAFDDFHLYDLNRTVALRNGEIKQVQFIQSAALNLQRTYIYDGAESVQLWYGNGLNQQQDLGIDTGSSKVHIVQQFKNTEANHLGIPLPAGRVRLYRQDGGPNDPKAQVEFVGESTIPHTAAEETIRLTTGSAFDIKGARRPTDFHILEKGHIIDETFEIKITNQKDQPVTVNVLEHLYRGNNWQITNKSANYNKLDSHTIEFPLQVPSKGETTLTYTTHYTW